MHLRAKKEYKLLVQSLIHISEWVTPTSLYLQASSICLPVGSHVWVEDPDVAWIDGEVLEVNGSDIKVLCTNGKTVSEHMAFYSRKEVSTLFIQLWQKQVRH